MKIRLSRMKLLIFVIIAGCITAGVSQVQLKQEYSIKVAVLYSGDSKTYLDTYQHFSQPLLMNLEVTAIDADKIDRAGIKPYNLVYPDISIRNAKNSEGIKEQIIDFAANGGAVFLENSFYDWFPKDFLGADSFREVRDLPGNLEFPEVRYDLKPLQKLINDFYEIFKKFRRQDKIKGKIFGCGMIEKTAVPIVKSGDIALYTLNYYQKGYVFFASPLLPNTMFITGFDMTAKIPDQNYFNNTAATANQMLNNEFAAFLAKQKYGYSLKKVFGPYGRPAMAWQNHFEVLSTIKQGAMEKWIDITREYDEIPSYSLARGVFEWATRYESIGYHINQDTGDGLVFQSHEEEAFYAAGKHAVVDNGWLTLKKCDESLGFFVDIGDIPDRAYPYVEDLNGDGIQDMVSGSSDGFFYFYEGLSNDEGWILKKPVKLSQINGDAIKVESFSAPVLYDIDGDGHKDLISGCERGEIFWFKNDGTFHFEPMGQLVTTPPSTRLSAPDIGDMDSDHIPDLLVGSKDGTIYFFKGIIEGGQISFKDGTPLKSQNGCILNAGPNATPRLIDLDGDNQNDLAVGTYDGYIRKFRNNRLVLSDIGYFDDIMPNYLGNFHIKNGNNVVPAFADLNGDGKLDLIVGRLEFGMAVAIDSPWFPYKKELNDALDYAKNNYVSIEPHNFTNHYKDSKAEKRELIMHKKAFETLGLSWEGVGTNQHTWKINSIDPLQTLLNEYESGLCWNSGFEKVNSDMDPAYGAESTWFVPFYLNNNGTETDMMVFSPSPSLEELHILYGYTAAWDTPVSYYHHSEYDSILNPDKLAKLAAFLDQFRNKNDYNFMTEQQMAKSFAAALNTNVQIERNPVNWILHTLQNNIRTLQQFEITIKPVVKMDGRKLLDSPYKNVAGVKVEVGEKFLTAPLATDADIYLRKGNNLYIGLNKPVNVHISKEPEKCTYIVRVNLPVEIAKKNGVMNIRILEGGMQQVKLHVPNNDLKINSSEWKIEKAEDSSYVLTRFGGPTELELSYSK